MMLSKTTECRLLLQNRSDTVGEPLKGRMSRTIMQFLRMESACLLLTGGCHVAQVCCHSTCACDDSPKSHMPPFLTAIRT